ncbi:MAG: TIGR02281 family clan AA aspartic protease [Methylocystis sp.]|nr:TIGR02281 family clan AA aspartic protease [Methylocystis sp.]
MFGPTAKLAIGVAFAAFVTAQIFAHFGQNGAPTNETIRAVAATNAVVKTLSAPPVAPLRASYGEVRIAADSLGQYAADVEIDGSRIHMLVDTGASSVALSYEDAAAVGLYPAPSDYKYAVGTANGTAKVARVKLRQVRLGELVVRDVDAFVGERGALGKSLLGMSFLSKLSHIEAAAGALVLKQ